MATTQTILIPFPKQRIPQQGMRRDRRTDNRNKNDDINSIISFLERARASAKIKRAMGMCSA
jgi:hypothetical protein